MVNKIINISRNTNKGISFKNNQEKIFNKESSNKSRDNALTIDRIAILSSAAIAAALAIKNNKNFFKLQDDIYIPALSAAMSGFSLYKGLDKRKTAKNINEYKDANMYTTIGLGGLIGIASGFIVNSIKNSPNKFDKLDKYGEIGLAVPIAVYIIKESITGIKNIISKKKNQSEGTK